jgi:hypothetical protein
VQARENKKLLIKWVTEQDLSGEMSLTKISRIPFNLDVDELSSEMNTIAICKVLKM